MLLLSKGGNHFGYVFLASLLVVSYVQRPVSSSALKSDSTFMGTFTPSKYTPPTINKICGSFDVYVNETRKCYRPDSQGPCGEYMTVKATEENIEIGTCQCSPSRCESRPTVYWPEEKRCYYIFDQGPCPSGKWLVPGEAEGDLKCETIPCPDKYNAQVLPTETFDGNTDFSFVREYVFLYDNKCYKTGTADESPCAEGKFAYFIHAYLKHVCLPYVSHGCGSSSTGGGKSDCPGNKKPDAHGGCEPKTEF